MLFTMDILELHYNGFTTHFFIYFFKILELLFWFINDDGIGGGYCCCKNCNWFLRNNVAVPLVKVFPSGKFYLLSNYQAETTSSWDVFSFMIGKFKI
jgi:hypothetical protein